MIFSAPVPFSPICPFALESPFVVTLSFVLATLFATTLVLLATPFVVGTLGDLVAVVLEAIVRGFRGDVVDDFVIVDDAPSVVFVAAPFENNNNLFDLVSNVIK